jgi:hypothetical protein
MDKRKQTLDTLAEMIDNLERLDISFLAGEEKSEWDRHHRPRYGGDGDSPSHRPHYCWCII